MEGKITFVGAGPGAEDLITIRGKKALDEADVIIYAGSLVNEKLLDGNSSARKCNSASLSFEEILAVMLEAYREGKKVVRLHTGDPAMYGAVSEQYRELDRLGIPYHVVPGVSSVFAAAAALKTEFTMPGITQTAILTRAAGRTPVPEPEELSKLAAHGTTLCLFLSVGDMEKVVSALLAAGRSPETPAAVVYRAGWDNEKVVRGTIADIAERVKEASVKRQAMIVIGEVLARNGEMSSLYNRDFAHGYRKQNAFRGTSAVFALTSAGALKAGEIAAGLDSKIILPEKLSHLVSKERVVTYPDGGLHEAFRKAWEQFDGLVMVMSSGIVVRMCAELCRHKSTDPAVVVTDEEGNHAVSLLSGHLGGANRLAQDVASITNGDAVVTTASDVRGIMAFDEMASRHALRVVNPEAIVKLATAVLEGKKVDLVLPEHLYRRYYANSPQYSLVSAPGENPAVVLLKNGEAPREYGVPVLYLKRKKFALGIGCRRDAALPDLEAVALQALESIGADWESVSAIATAEFKLDEPAILQLAFRHSIPVTGYSAEELNRIDVPDPSPAAMENLGINSVSEAAAILASGGGALAVRKIKGNGATAALAEKVDHES